MAPLESGAAAKLDLSWETFEWVWPIVSEQGMRGPPTLQAVEVFTDGAPHVVV